MVCIQRIGVGSFVTQSLHLPSLSDPKVAGMGEWVGDWFVSTEHMLHILYLRQPHFKKDGLLCRLLKCLPQLCSTVGQESLTWVSLSSCVAADAMFTLTVWHMMGTPPTDPGEILGSFCSLLLSSM